MLPIRTLGDLTVPAIGFGAMVLSPGMYGEGDDETGLRALRHAFDAGATFVDTADGYGPAGHNEDTVGAVADLIRDGLVLHLGLSNVDADQLRRTHAVHPVAAVQVEWSLFRPIDTALLATARELGVGVVAWGLLGTGLLTGDVRPVGADDFRRHMDRFAEASLASTMDRYAPLRALAADLAITPGQLALAWLLHQYEHAVPIPGSRQPAHIDENLHAALVDLPPATFA